MDDLNGKDYFSNTYYNPNNFQLYKKTILNNQVKHNNYINQGYNKYESISQKQMLSNNNNDLQDCLSLIQIRNDLNLLNDKLNIISETLFNTNLFNIPSKKIINLKKCNSMNNKIIKNNNKKISPYIYNSIYNFQNSKFENKNPNKIIMNNKTNEIINNNDINNQKICRNNYKIFSEVNSKVNPYTNNYFAQSMNICKPQKNKNIKNIKYKRNNSLLSANLIKNDKYTFDDTLNINNALSNNKSINSPTNIVNKNVEYNNYFNSCFGLYDQYFLESLSDNIQTKKENNNNKTQNVKDMILNQIQNNKIEQNKNINKTINNNKNDIKKRLNFSVFNDINAKKDNLKYKDSPKLLLSKKLNSFNMLNYKIIKNEQIKEIKPQHEENTINNEEKNQTQNNNQISDEKKIINQKREEEIFQKDNYEKINKIKDIKKRKNLSFHEEDNIIIEYKQKDEITKINVYNFFGENQNFRPRNFNVIIEKLKRKKYKNNSILFKNSLKKDLIKEEKQNKSKGIKKIKNSKSKISISSKKEEMLLNKYILKKGNSNPKNKKKNYIQKRNKICKKFRNNPQLFYSEELCDLVIKSFDTDEECLNVKRDKSRNMMKKINYNKNYDKRGNLTDIDIDNRPMECLQKIIEETE